MGFFNSVGNAAERFSTAQQNNSFYLVTTPLFMQFLDLCVLRYPDPLDLYEWSYEIIPLYFLAGAIDYGILIFTITTYSYFALIASPGVSHEDAGPLWSKFQSPRSRTFSGLLFLSFAIRAWRLGLGTIQKTCNLRNFHWHEMRKLCVLILLLCPALSWHLIFEALFDLFKLDENRPWLPQLFWLILSRDWGTAQFYSGWLVTKGKETLRQENAAKLNETWTDFTIRCLKIAAIATPIEIAVRNLPYIVLVSILAVGQNRAAISGFLERFARKFRPLRLVKTIENLDKFPIRWRDFLILHLVRQCRRGLFLWRKADVPIRVKILARALDATFDRIYLICYPSFDSVIRGTSQQTRVMLRFFRRHRYSDTTTAPLISNRPDHTPVRRFRLLHVEPSTSKTHPIICTLTWHDLDSTPIYTAISYVWGSSEANSTIILNGEDYQTTSSALTALKGLRSRWRKKRFWIDAICIDQTSNADKAEQISIMAGIYRNAKQVTVWLGVDPDGTLALSLARRLWIRTRLGGVIGSSKYSLDAPEPAWSGLRRLLHNNWFQRSWIVQEVMSNNVVVRYGDAEISWITLSQFAMAVENESQSIHKLHSLTDVKNPDSSRPDSLKIKYIRIIEEFRSLHSGTEQNLSLLFYLIKMFRSGCRFKAINTQDRIYALLNLSGLANDTAFNDMLNRTGLLGNVNPRNTPDYPERLSAFFTTVARHFLSSGPANRRLDFLAHAGIGHIHGRDRLLGFPSWVPDWSLEDPPCLPFMGYDGTLELLQHPRLKGVLEDVAELQSYDEISFRGRPKKEQALKNLDIMAKTMTEKTVYRATRDTLPNIVSHEDDNVLELYGASVDRIRTLGSPYSIAAVSPSTADIYTSISALLLSWYGLFLGPNRPATAQDVATGEFHRVEFVRTVLADLSQPTFDFTLPHAPVRPSPDLTIARVTILMALGATTISLDTMPHRGVIIAQLKECVEHLDAVCRGRVFGITENGRMGLFMQGCEVGDEVCLFEGSGLPFVIRRTDGNVEGGKSDKQPAAGIELGDVETKDREQEPDYELVGAAYVRGIMDGEGMGGKSMTETFRLK